jgi:hypothetical protein
MSFNMDMDFSEKFKEFVKDSQSKKRRLQATSIAMDDILTIEVKNEEYPLRTLNLAWEIPQISSTEIDF